MKLIPRHWLRDVIVAVGAVAAVWLVRDWMAVHAALIEHAQTINAIIDHLSTRGPAS